MFNFKAVSLTALILIIILVIVNFQRPVHSGYYIGIVLLHLVMVLYGSFSIKSNFFTTSICSFKSTKNEIALTFDDGPHPVITPIVLKILKEKKVKATFFCIGQKVEQFPEIAKQIVEEGHDIGLHSFSHSYFYDFYFKRKLIDDLRKNQQVVFAATGIIPQVFRPPYGVTTPFVAMAAQVLKLSILGWSVRSLDTVTSNPNKILRRIVRKLKAGSIILLHDHLEKTPVLLRSILEVPTIQKYNFVNLRRIISNPIYKIDDQ